MLEVEFLGFLIGKEGIRIDPRRIDFIATWPQPISIKEI